MRYEIDIPSVINPNEEFSVQLSSSGVPNVFTIEQNGRYYITEMKPVPTEPEKSIRLVDIKNKSEIVLRPEFSELQTRITRLEKYNSLGAENWRELLSDSVTNKP